MPYHRRRVWPWLLTGGVFTLLVGGYVGAMLLLPAPAPVLHMSVQSGALDTGKPTPLPWPVTGGGALGFGGRVVAASNGDQQFATASVAKVILALSVLTQKPLQVGDTGPTITLTDTDLGYYYAEQARGGSTVAVAAGESLSEYQALQAMLLPSGNNMAHTLADWAFGSEQKYIQYAQAMLAGMGLSKTVLADASGYSPKTVSTPADLTAIGQAALKNPVLAQIVSQKTATVPVAGAIDNTNEILGSYDVTGIKTGSSDAAGGCLLFSATRQVDGQSVTLVGSLLGLEDLDRTFAVTPPLLDAGFRNMVTVAGATASQVVGTVTTGWSAPINVIAKQTAAQTLWAGTRLDREVTASLTADGFSGSIKVGATSTPLALASSISQPSYQWRLTHPVEILSSYFARR